MTYRVVDFCLYLVFKLVGTLHHTYSLNFHLHTTPKLQKVKQTCQPLAIMESAKEAISKLTSRHGHTTEVDERVNPSVTSETVKPTRHENITEAVDREVHRKLRHFS